jgi:putative transcriptional regulator
MSAEVPSINLTNHFLIAMPGLRDDAFVRSVVFMCEHSPKGALGLVINKPSGLVLAELFEKLDLPLRRQDLKSEPVLQGGPLQTERGFVLHDAMGKVEPVGEDETPPAVARAIQDAVGLYPTLSHEEDEEDDVAPEPSAYASTMKIAGAMEMTTSRDILEAVSSGAGPKRLLVSLGYSSWGEGQLESEISENSWLTVKADPAIIFDTPVEQRYDKAMALLGLQAWMIMPGSGHA